MVVLLHTPLVGGAAFLPRGAIRFGQPENGRALWEWGKTAPNAERTISRRKLFKYGTFAGAAATIGPALPPLTSAAHANGLPRVLPAPKPIPGGIELPDGTVIRTFVPGPEDVTLPFTGIELQGLDVEPSVITDYRGFTTLAYHAGTATGSDGNQYDLETDIRAMQGTYVAEDGSRQRGLFALI